MFNEAQIKFIESVRGTTEKLFVVSLRNLKEKAQGFKDPYNCLCKTSDVLEYRDSFYLWYD